MSGSELSEDRLDMMSAAVADHMLTQFLNRREPDRLAPVRCLTADQVADALGIGRGKVYELCDRGELPSLRIDGRIRVPVGALAGWIEQHVKGRVLERGGLAGAGSHVASA